jgi:hypothetical protein
MQASLASHAHERILSHKERSLSVGKTAPPYAPEAVPRQAKEMTLPLG